MKINILKLTLLILSSTFLISCGSTKQLFDYGSVKTSNQIETIKISNINNLPICKVLIGEKEYNFLIDTGAPTVIPNEIFQRLKLKSFFTEEITDANNKKRKQNFTILPEIKIDNLIFKEIGCVVMDIETPALKCFGFDGIIGANLLAKMVWQFGEMGYDYSIDALGGRTSEKPSAWSYLNLAHRKAAYDMSSKIITLRKMYPAAFTQGNFSLNI